jgi:hypothetical protein
MPFIVRFELKFLRSLFLASDVVALRTLLRDTH